MAWFGKKKKKQETAEESPQTEQIIPETVKNGKAEAAEEEKPVPAAESKAEKSKEDTRSEKDKSGGLISRLKKGLSKTREVLTTDIDDLFRGKRKVDADLLEEIEELLITSDMGVQTTMKLMEKVGKKSSKISTASELKEVLKTEIRELMKTPDPNLEAGHKPHVIMVIGVNGVGKTTTIGKLAARFSGEGKKVLVAAADTFRAAAVEQLVIWAERAGADIVRHRDNADPAAVAFDAVEAAVSRGKDIVIVDTAGRLHTKVNLMEELKKIRRAVEKVIPDAPHETLLVLDATTGQNALSQARLFNEAMGITGLILTKLDGTAKGGVVISICDTLDIPLCYIGVGEQVDDLQKFDPVRFADALFS
ncbi:MAG: signal recognition particle-docking protein FtsY [Desulfobacterales bacterium]